MASGKEIKGKIGSIKNTQKITSAMEMVAASKMKRAQERMASGRPYAQNMLKVIGHIANGNLEFRHPYLEEREVKRVGYIVVSTDRGLCGGLNINVFKKTVQSMAEHDQNGIEIDICAIGAKSATFFNNFGGNVVSSKSQLGEKAEIAELIGAVKIMLDGYDEGRLDAVYVVYNNFVNTMTQQPNVVQLLPLQADPNDDGMSHHWDYLYEPDARELLTGLLTRYVESLVYQAVVENNACEQAARMIAMKSATDNAGDLIDDLQMIYNKARQSAITQEISEIVSGAAAV